MWYDLVILLILVLAILRGAMRGFVWQLASIAALVLCFAFAGSFSLAVAPYISVEPPLNRWIAMFVLYLIFSFISFGVARLLRGWIEKAKFVEFDRHLGSLFGFLKGATFCLVLTFFVVTLSEKTRAHVLQSHSGYLAAIIMDRLHPVMPNELRDVLEPYIHQLDRDELDLHHTHHVAHDGDDESPADPAPYEEPVGDSGGKKSGPLADWMAELPTIVDEELRQTIARALENTAPEDRDDLLHKLSSGVPGLMRAVADEWKDGKPPEPNPPESEREMLLREISSVYSDFPDGQEAIIEQIDAVMAGVPDSIALAVFRDWHADLLALDPDPDPQTDVATSLDGRIVRQLEIASSARPESPALR